MKYYYKFKTYLNAKHRVEFDGNSSIIHPHTWEFVMTAKVASGIEINFTEFEKKATDFLREYQGKVLNDTELFIGKNPTTEVIGRTIYGEIKKSLNQMELVLVRFEISENPSRTYIMVERNDGKEICQE